jgi:hypothetical protein
MIERNENRGLFTRISNAVLRDPSMSAEELGLYASMLSRPDNWEFSEYVLSKQFGTTPQEIRRILLSLERKGYTRERRGRYGPVWDLFERPEKPQPAPQPPEPAAAPAEEHTLTSEEIGQRLIDHANYLRRLAAERKAADAAKQIAPRTSAGQVTTAGNSF